MALFQKDPSGPAPYPTEDQAPYTNEQYPSDQQLPYPPSRPSLPRTDSSFSQSSSFKKSNRIMDYRPPPRQARAILEKAPAKETEYMGMLLHQSQVIEKQPYWNILAAGCTWILLAGFIVLPGTYTNFQNSDIIQAAQKDPTNVGNQILASVANIGLLIVASILCGLGLLGITGLWLRWRANYIWLINRVLLPALLNAVMGLLSTLVNVLSKPNKTFTVPALVTTSVTGGLTLIWTCMFLYYNNYLLDAVKEDHRKAYGDQDAKDAIANNNGQPMVV